MKKFLFSMICTLLPILASAQVQNEELTPYAVLSDDHTVLTFFYDNDKESQGGMDIGPFTSADERGWNEYCENIEQVVFVEAFAGCEAITSTRYWFQNFTNLTTIIGLGNLKTNNVTDMASMFDGCSSLTSLDLGGFETSQVTDMTYIFAGCSGLTSLDVNGFNTSNTKSMAGMFRDCSGLTSLDISAFDTSEATEMSEMFSGCSGLTSLDLGDNFNTSNVTTMNSMFSGCSNLSNLDVSGFETPEVTNMGAMFNNCSMLTSLDLGDNFNTSNVTNMEAMFSGCSNLESLDVSNFNTANVTAMGSMFGGCSKLTTLDLSGFDTSNATDLSHMFALCSGLTSLDVTGFNTSNATNMVCMFEGCSGLTSLDVSNFDISNATNLSSMFILCSGLTSLDVSGFNTSNATDLSSMFAGCSGLTSLDVSGSFDTSNATNLSAMFEDCSSLTNLDLSGFNTANATNLSSMFIRCSGLTSLDVSNFNTANVTDMGNMFDGCSKLVSLDVSGLNTGNVTNMGYMFSDCLKLTSPLDVSEFNTANVVRMDYMFNHCESLTALDVSNFNTANVTTMGSMFNYCSNLESLDVSNFNTEKVTYMAWMFADCSNLTSLDVSNFNTTNVTDMGAMFTSCSGLTELDLSNFDTSNTTTLELFFNKCSGLTSLDLSNFNTANVKNMDSMFSQCSGLETISTGNEWSTENIESGAGMFIGCTALVGGAGTTYDANHVDYTYARVDGGATNPGYFTDPNQPVPYAVLNEDNSVLTFYYDDQKAARGGMGVGPFNEASQRGWKNYDNNIQSVVFDESFANCTTITSTSYWFYCSGLSRLTTITGLGNLKTDNVTDMSHMFRSCSKLTSLDLSGFNTSNVTDMTRMFYSCPSLTTIYAGEGWNTDKITSGEEMFNGCNTLIGGRGTKYNSSHIDAEYAHIDGGTSNPGYLTDINAASEETWEKLQSRIEYGTDVLSKAKEISTIDQALIEKLDEALQNANQMYKIHEASEDEVLHMIEVLNERINNVEEAMNQPASDETWTELKATIEYGTDVLAKAKEISTIDQWLIEELDMTLDSGNQMYKIHEASEEVVLNMIDELNWRIKEVEEAMNQPASDEAWAELNKAVETGEKLQTEAKGVSTVEPWALEELENMTAKGSEMYKVHTAGEEEVRHMTEELNQIINEVEEMMRKQPQGEASFDGLTAYVSGNATLDDAFKSVGGRSEAAKTIAAIVWNADNALTADMLSGIDNPNLLVYVTEASKAPSGVQNVIIDGVASEIVLTDATGNNNFYCPQSFTAKSISYSRDFSQTTEIDVCRGWETIALPFDVQSITHESHGTLVPFGGSDNGYPFWLRQLSTNGLARATKIEANRPYLICMPNNIIYPPEYNQNGTVTFSSSNVTVPVTSARSSTSAGVTLHATFQQVTKSSSVYALNVGETRGEYPEGSVFEQNYRDIRPFQAYTTHSAGTRSFITLESLGGNDDATGIEELRIKNSEFGDAEGVWYSLDGRRLDAKPTKKGVYVKDGRKIVIK